MGLLSLYQAYFVPSEGFAAIGAFFVGITLTCAAAPFFALAIWLSPDAPAWLVASVLAGAALSAGALLAVLVVAGGGAGGWVAVGLAGAAFAAAGARRRRLDVR